MVIFNKYYFNSLVLKTKDDTRVGMGSKKCPLKKPAFIYYTN